MRLVLSNCLNWKITAMIILHFLLLLLRACMTYIYVFHLQMHLSVENTYNIYAGNVGLLTYSDFV